MAETLTLTLDQAQREMERIIARELKVFGDDVDAACKAAVPKTARKAVRQLKETAPRGKKDPPNRKHYADNWTYKITNGRLTCNGVIYNKDPTYRVAHLLEHGHGPGRRGFRVKAYPHIAAVAGGLEGVFMRNFQLYF